jgi:iron complex outermembrane receptor protein
MHTLLKYHVYLALQFICLYGSAQFKGQVIQEENKLPLPFATVYLLDFQVGKVCDAQGYFVFEQELPDEFSVKISATDFEIKVVQVTKSPEIQLFSLRERHLELNEVTASTPRTGLQSRSATYVDSRRMDELESMGASNLGEALQRIPGVYAATSGTGVSKPVIRGLQGQRILTLLNGVRLENQQWGGDHDLGFTSLGIGAVEVIKGPASLLYGSDALGGVLYFSDEEYARPQEGDVHVSTGFESNTLSSKSELGLRMSGKNVRFNAAGNYVNSADYTVPSGLYVPNSRFNATNAKMAFGAFRKSWVTHLRYGLSTQEVGIIGGHAHSEEEESEEDHEEETLSDHQERQIEMPYQRYENHLLSWENKWLRKKQEWYLLLGQGVNILQEFEDSSAAAMQLNLYNTSANLRYKFELNPRFEGIAGWQGSWITNQNKGAEEQLIPDYQQWDNGLYFLGYIHLGKWDLQTGLRGDVRSIHAEGDSLPDFDRLLVSPNFAIGAVRDAEKHTFRINFSSGVRMPHLSEWLTDGAHHGALRYELGNATLKPERALQLDLTEEIHGAHVELIFNPFVYRIQDYIYLHPLDSLIDSLPAYAYRQLNAVWFTGFDLSLHYHPHFAHWLHWLPSFSWLLAQDEQGNALNFIPQARLANELKATFGWKKHPEAVECMLQYQFLFDQYRVGVLETPSKHYHLLNFALNISPFKNELLKVRAGVKNLLNTQYIDHLSRLKNEGIQNPGRNVYVQVSWNPGWKKQKK